MLELGDDAVDLLNQFSVRKAKPLCATPIACPSEALNLERGKLRVYQLLMLAKSIVYLYDFDSEKTNHSLHPVRANVDQQRGQLCSGQESSHTS